MNNSKIAMLYTPYEWLSEPYAREFVKNGALSISVPDIYARYGRKGAEKKIAKIVRENNIQLLLYMGDPQEFVFSLDFFRMLQNEVFTSMLLTDADHYFDGRDIYYAQGMDLILTCDCLSRHKFMHHGIDAVSFYSVFDCSKYIKSSDVPKKTEVSFVGEVGMKMSRKTYLDYAAQKGVSVEIYGHNTKNGYVSLERMVEIFNETKINLNFMGFATATTLGNELNIRKMAKQIKGRIAEIALCGGFVLTDYALGTEEVFEIGKEIIVFTDRDDMVDKIKYYLAHDKEREEIAERGYKRATRDYDTRTAIPRLIAILEEARQKKIEKHRVLYELFTDPCFERNYATYRFEMFIKFLKDKKWGFAIEELMEIIKKRRINVVRAVKIIVSNLFPALRMIYRKKMGERY